ncbi:iron ABC transporter permease [Clostridium botulinum]|nr:iron ABC transporter permease [Clostridium botulinum]
MQKTYNKKRQLGALNFTIYMIVGVVLLVIMSAASISFGAADMNLTTAWGAIFNFDSSLTEHQIIQTLRLPRIAANIIVGSSLAICGAIMQGTTRNPLADSGLMGISSGATFAMAFVWHFTWWKLRTDDAFACIGAAITTGMTYFIASIGRGGMKPQRLVLAGISISMLFGAFSQYLSIKYKLGHALAYWTAGGTAGAKWSELAIVFPFFIVGIIVAFVISPSITVLNLGDDAAIGLGINTKKVKGVSTVVVLILTGISVIVVGPVGFVGLIVPHIVRYLIGVDYRYIIPASGLYGALITVTADLVGRLINKPYETPIGIILL